MKLKINHLTYYFVGYIALFLLISYEKNFEAASWIVPMLVAYQLNLCLLFSPDEFYSPVRSDYRTHINLMALILVNIYLIYLFMDNIFVYLSVWLLPAVLLVVIKIFLLLTSKK